MGKNKSIQENMDIIKYFIIKISVGVLSFLSISLYTYLISPDTYGEYSLILGLVNIIISIFIGWISSSCLRYYNKYKEDPSVFYSTIIINWIVMIAISSVIIIFMGIVIKEINFSSYFGYAIGLLVTSSIFEIFNFLIRGAKKTNLLFWVSVLQYAINMVLFYILVDKFKMGIEAIFVSNIVSYAVLAIVNIIKFKIFKNFKFNKYSRTLQLEFLKYGLPMIGVWGINWILNYSDRYIIKIFCSTFEVGLYDIAYKVSENSINMIITTLSMAMMPALIALWDKCSKYDVEKKHGEYLNYFFILIIPAIVGIISIRSLIYGTIIDISYIQGTNVIVYIAISMFFVGLNQFLYKLWQLNEKTYKILIYMAISVIINIILNLIFIPIYGFVVAAVTTMISTMVSSLFVILDIRREFHICINFRSILQSIFSSGIMYVFIKIVFISQNLIIRILGIVIAVMLYFILLIVMGTLKKEVELIKDYIQKVCDKKNPIIK